MIERLRRWLKLFCQIDMIKLELRVERCPSLVE